MKKEIKTIKLDKFLNSLGLAMAMAHANYDKAFESIQDRFKTFENTPVQERAILFALKTLHKDLKTQFWQEVEKLTPEKYKDYNQCVNLKDGEITIVDEVVHDEDYIENVTNNLGGDKPSEWGES